jgi:hypothetical protein
VEGDISHCIKGIKGKRAKIYCKETVTSMLIVSILKLNNKVNEKIFNLILLV